MTHAFTGSRRDALPLDLLQAQSREDLLADALKGLFPEDQVNGFMTPKEDLAEFLFLLCDRADGREVFDWLMDITIRAPYRVQGKSIEETALWAARREGMALVGELILAALARGRNSIAARSPGVTPGADPRIKPGARK